MLLGMPEEEARVWLRGLAARLDEVLAERSRPPLVVVPRREPEPPRRPWRERAACAAPDVDPEWFHSPDVEDYPDPMARAAESRRRSRLALQVCAACPVTADCYRERSGDRWGVWGGTTPVQRRQGRRQ